MSIKEALKYTTKYSILSSSPLASKDNLLHAKGFGISQAALTYDGCVQEIKEALGQPVFLSSVFEAWVPQEFCQKFQDINSIKPISILFFSGKDWFHHHENAKNLLRAGYRILLCFELASSLDAEAIHLANTYPGHFLILYICNRYENILPLKELHKKMNYAPMRLSPFPKIHYHDHFSSPDEILSLYKSCQQNGIYVEFHELFDHSRRLSAAGEEVISIKNENSLIARFVLKNIFYIIPYFIGVLSRLVGKIYIFLHGKFLDLLRSVQNSLIQSWKGLVHFIYMRIMKPYWFAEYQFKKRILRRHD